MQVTLPAETEHLINDMLATGRYRTVGEVLAAAIQLLDEHERESQEHLDRLRQDIQAGIDDIAQGRFGPFDLQKFLAECNAKFDQNSQ
jgi:putative addiction module CopG family antidote